MRKAKKQEAPAQPAPKFSHGDVVQVTSRDSKHFPKVVVVHQLIDETQQLSCYETGAGGQPVKVIVAHHEVDLIGKAKIKWHIDRPLPAFKPVYNDPLDKI